MTEVQRSRVEVFISYSHLDRPRVYPIADRLEALGFRVFVDKRDLRPGDVYQRVLGGALEAPVTLGMFSPNAFASNWVLSEWNSAGDRLVPVQIIASDEPAPNPFNVLDVADLSDFDGTVAHLEFRRLLTALADRLARPGLPHFVKLCLDPGAPDVAGWVAEYPADPLAPNAEGILAAERSRHGPYEATQLAMAWREVEHSILVDDYVAFQSWFGRSANRSKQADETNFLSLASKRLEQLRAWEDVDRDDVDAITSFATEALFPALARVVESEADRARATQAERRALVEEADRLWDVADKSDSFVLGRLRAAADTPAMLWSRIDARIAELKRPGRAFQDTAEGFSPDEMPEIIVIGPGHFQRGAGKREEGATRHERPRSRIEIGNAFGMSTTPVTFAQWDAIVRASRAYWPTRDPWRAGFEVLVALPELDDLGWGRGNNPAVDVSWHMARQYCRWLSVLSGKPYRLPTEAEWEFCCRAGHELPYGASDKIDQAQANFDDRDSAFGDDRKSHFRARTTPARTFSANAFGLYDMQGNVWEWVEDVWTDNLASAPTDGSALLQGSDPSQRVLRGGGWDAASWQLRCAHRRPAPREYRLTSIGFRVARDL